MFCTPTNAQTLHGPPLSRDEAAICSGAQARSQAAGFTPRTIIVMPGIISETSIPAKPASFISWLT